MQLHKNAEMADSFFREYGGSFPDRPHVLSLKQRAATVSGPTEKMCRKVYQ